MLYWIPYAFIRISVFFIAGILLAIAFPTAIAFPISAGAFGLLTGLYFLIYFLNLKKRRTVINPGLVGLLAVFFAGYANIYLSTDTSDNSHIQRFKDPILAYSAVVDNDYQEKENVWKQVVNTRKVLTKNGWQEASGQVLIYLPKREFEGAFNYGDVVLIKGSAVEVVGPQNPGEFNYKSFLAARNIYHNHFLSRDDLIIFDNRAPSSLMEFSINCRHWADDQIKRVVKGERERAIASALVLGITDRLDNDLMGAYAASGALHVLSVSGLHVGIMYMVLAFFLRPFLKLKNGKWIVALISLLVLWIYACVTGLSPSVLRAVTMFSFMAMARPLNQQTNIYNVLAASAFCLLLFDPFLILSIGFQLSYLAVIGIVYLQPLLYNAFEPANRLVDEAWKVTSVSIAAQLATFSLGLLYFHQFPSYFLLSNLFVLPLGFAILVGGLATLAVSFITPLAMFLGTLLEWTIRILNFLIFATESLPYSVIDGISISAFQCAMLLGFTVCVILFVQHRKTMSAYLAVCSIVMFSISSWVTYWENASPRLAVYSIKGSSAYDLMEAGVVFAFADPAKKADDFRVSPNRVLRKIRTVEHGRGKAFSRELAYGTLTLFNGKSILQLTSRPPEIASGIEVDYLIVSHNALRSFEELPERLSAKLIIIDSSNSFRLADELWKENIANKYPVHSVWHQGAFDKTI